MDTTMGILKLERIIKARRALEIKIKTMPDNEVVKRTIEEHKKTIDTLKKALNFEDRYDVNSCTCPETEEAPKISLPTKGDIINEGEVQGVFIKVKLLKKDGGVGNQIRYVEVG